MARIGVDYETIKQAAVKLLSQGIAPSVQKIREELGTGSNTTIAEHLKAWRDEYAKKTIHHLPPNMPKELVGAMEVLWQTAMEQAQNQLEEYKQALGSERERALQIQRDSEKTVIDIKLALDEMSTKLEQEIAEKQKLIVDLAIANDRLEKLDEQITAQKDQYEDRLKRIYAEKDNTSAQCCQLQDELKALQEKFSSQVEQHQNLLAQQNALHQQSEDRWSRLIDQARQETKDTNKKMESLRAIKDDELKKLKATIPELQKNLYECNAQLKISAEQIAQLKQEVKHLETENIKAKSTIMTFEKGQKRKDSALSIKRKLKKEIQHLSDAQ